MSTCMLHRLPFLWHLSIRGAFSPSITFIKVSGNFILPPAVYMVQVLNIQVHT